MTNCLDVRKYLISDYFGTRQIMFGNNMNAIGNHFSTRSEGRFHIFMTERKTDENLNIARGWGTTHIMTGLVGVQNNLKSDKCEKNMENRGSYLTRHCYLTRHLPQYQPCKATF